LADIGIMFVPLVPSPLFEIIFSERRKANTEENELPAGRFDSPCYTAPDGRDDVAMLKDAVLVYLKVVVLYYWHGENGENHDISQTCSYPF